MYKQTVAITQPAYLKLRHGQLVILLTESKEEITRPIDQLGYLILENPQITITQQLVAKLTEHNVATVFCDARRYPSGLVLPLDGHHIQTKRFHTQWTAKASLKKQLWKKIIQAKIRAQATLLAIIGAHEASEQLTKMIRQVTSGDGTKMESQAARLYWKHLFGKNFVRAREGDPPNHLLNYGYAVLRAATARALIGRGLLPSCSIQHHNRYNAYPLADDVMEPYRPFVDHIVWQLSRDTPLHPTLTYPYKATLLTLLQATCLWQAQRTTLATALDHSATQFISSFDTGKSPSTLFPTFTARKVTHSNR